VEKNDKNEKRGGAHGKKSTGDKKDADPMCGSGVGWVDAWEVEGDGEGDGEKDN